MELTENIWLAALLVVVTVGMLAVLTESGAIAIVLGLAFLVVVGYLAYVLLARLHDAARHGKPIIRSGGGES